MIAASELIGRLADVPRVELCHAPTPLESWPRLASHWCAGSRILVKRDDLNGPGLGGNKSRQLEFLLGDALAMGADVIVHGGAVQSNYCRQLAAACAVLGLDCRLVLSTAYGQPVDQGGHLLSRLFGAKVTLVECPLGAEHERRKAAVRDELTGEGRVPYLITYPNSETLGSLGYVAAAIELADQLRATDAGLPDVLVVAAVGATYAGLLLGLGLLGIPLPIVGFAPLSREYDIVPSIRHTVAAAAVRLGLQAGERADVSDLLTRCADSIDIRFDQVGAGYAIPTQDGLAALHDVASLQGVLLDPVYTSKAAAGLRTLLRPERSALFIHTGGATATFAYAGAIAQFLEEHDA